MRIKRGVSGSGGNGQLSLSSLRRVVDQGVLLLADRLARGRAKGDGLWDFEAEARKRALVLLRLGRYGLVDLKCMETIERCVAAGNFDGSLRDAKLMLVNVAQR